MALQRKQGLIALIVWAIPLFFWVLESQWKHFQRGFYPRIAEIEKILTLECFLRSPAIFSSRVLSLKRGATPSGNGYLWDGLFNRRL
ncbi:MAG TPA: hypothetical protein V6D37_14295 [Candidatus Sericytochromatia bacterium]